MVSKAAVPEPSGSSTKRKLPSRFLTGSPRGMATSSAARMQPVAPSLSPAALPAVIRPCGRNGVLSPARLSAVVPGRGGSSAVASPQPCLALRVVTHVFDPAGDGYVVGTKGNAAGHRRGRRHGAGGVE